MYAGHSPIKVSLQWQVLPILLFLLSSQSCNLWLLDFLPFTSHPCCRGHVWLCRRSISTPSRQRKLHLRLSSPSWARFSTAMTINSKKRKMKVVATIDLSSRMSLLVDFLLFIQFNFLITYCLILMSLLSPGNFLPRAFS